MVYAYVPNFVSIGIFCHPLATKNANVAGFFLTLAFCGVASWRQSNRKLNVTFWLPWRQVKSYPYQTCHGDRGP